MPRPGARHWPPRRAEAAGGSAVVLSSSANVRWPIPIDSSQEIVARLVRLAAVDSQVGLGGRDRGSRVGLAMRFGGGPTMLETLADTWFPPLAEDPLIAGKPHLTRALTSSHSVHVLATSCASRTAHATRSMT